MFESLAIGPGARKAKPRLGWKEERAHGRRGTAAGAGTLGPPRSLAPSHLSLSLCRSRCRPSARNLPCCWGPTARDIRRYSRRDAKYGVSGHRLTCRLPISELQLYNPLPGTPLRHELHMSLAPYSPSPHTLTQRRPQPQLMDGERWGPSHSRPRQVNMEPSTPLPEISSGGWPSWR